MTGAERIERAAEITEAFAEDTGLTSDRPADRYLWTDAFAVCNALGLHEATGERRWLRLALRLVEQVHRVLGRHRADDPREGWISGLDEEEGARRPTAGGLRIGKPEPERGPDEPADPRGEWDRDGQYYHYLTRWAHALNRTWRVTGEERHHRWATELMAVAHEGFVRRDREGEPRIVWKMSIELDRPLVSTEGEHDPLDGLVTTRLLRATAPDADGPPERPGCLEDEEDELRSMCRGRRWETDDPLGLGGLLCAAWWTAWLGERGRGPGGELLETVVEDAASGLASFARAADLDSAAGYRLAFRELGLAVGLAAAERLLGRPGRGEGPRGEAAGAGPSAEGPRRLRREAAASLRRRLPMRREIEDFWLDPAPREADAWREHREINRVTLATSLAPSGYLDV